MSTDTSRKWSREELVMAFNLYCRTPFGKLHKSNPEVVDLTRAIGRTPSALAMKLVNFASLDPAQKARGIKGLSNVSNADRAIWEEFHSDWEGLAHESELAMKEIISPRVEQDSASLRQATELSVTEKIGESRIRLVQAFFRGAVLASYDYRCAMCAIEIPTLLVASHIIPWSANKARRADPTNGLSLCALHDRAFDRGIIAVDDSHRILLSKAIERKSGSRVHQVALSDIEGNQLTLPDRFAPDVVALKYHRDNIFTPN